MKERVNVSLKEGLSEKAQRLGINVSKTCEIALDEKIKVLEGAVKND